MADRKPIVYISGYPQELADSDRISGVPYSRQTVSATAPSNPATGDIWLDTNGNILKVYTGSDWTEPTEDLSAAVVAASAPSNPTNGLLWFDTTTNQLKVYISSTSQWELAESQTYVSGTTPSSPLAGEFWWDTTNERLKIYTGSAWDEVGHKTFSSGIAPTSGMVEGDWWYNSVSGAFSMYIAGSLNTWLIVSSGGGSGGGGSISDILAFS